MKKIPLTQNKFALVDDNLYEWLSQWKWYYKLRSDGINGDAVRTLNAVKGHTNKSMRMQNQIMPPNPGCVIDHANLVTLDNRWRNLRQATKANNGYNRALQRNNTTGLKGISWHKRDQHYRVQIRIGNGRRITKGFDSIDEAIKFRDSMYAKYHGKFGRKS